MPQAAKSRRQHVLRADGTERQGEHGKKASKARMAVKGEVA
jgi:hypothetical protein